MIDAILKSIARRPDAIFAIVRTADGDEVIHFGTLLIRARRFAALYARENLPPGGDLFLDVPPGVELMSAWIGALLRGLVPCIVPANWEQAPEPFWERLSKGVETVWLGRSRCALGPNARFVDVEDHRDVSPEPFSIGVAESGPALFLIWERGGLRTVSAAHAFAEVTSRLNEMSLHAEDRIVSTVPLSTQTGLVVGLLAPLVAGASVILIEKKPEATVVAGKTIYWSEAAGEAAKSVAEPAVG